jgi:transcriptional regulator with XRE-family HTH domain
MRKARERSMDFARWVVSSRKALGKTQPEIAKKASLSQQVVSKIELEGVIPNTQQLAHLCAALGKNVGEAEATFADKVYSKKTGVYEAGYLAFWDSLIQKSKAPGTLMPIRVFEIHDDEHWHWSDCSHYHRLLSESGQLRLTVMYRYASGGLCFSPIAERLAAMWREHNRDIAGLREKFFGYRRRPEKQEDERESLPLTRYLILVVDNSCPYLYSCGPDTAAMNELMRLGVDETVAREKSRMLLGVGEGNDSTAVRRVVHWLGGVSAPPIADYWTEIPWYVDTEENRQVGL